MPDNLEILGIDCNDNNFSSQTKQSVAKMHFQAQLGFPKIMQKCSVPWWFAKQTMQKPSLIVNFLLNCWKKDVLSLPTAIKIRVH